MRQILVAIIFCALTQALSAQTGIGIRFASNVNYFPRPLQHGLVTGGFTTGVLGVFFSNYTLKSGFEVGLNLNYKDDDDKGFPNLPVVMRDWGGDTEQNVGYSGIEMDLKVGPRFWALYPRIGYIFGYRWKQNGFFSEPSTARVNNLYLMLPFGVASNWPARWGTVGFGAYYNVGVLNVVMDPTPGGGGIYDGGRQRYLTLEMTVSYSVKELRR